jgi:glycosyltransferase involved in cell wall biosynthesis
MTFSLESFETACYTRQHEVAGRELASLLQDLDRNFGALSQGFQAQGLRGLAPQELNAHFVTRICAAISSLFADPDFNFSPDWQKRLFELHRWMSALFAASPFHNADHVLRALVSSEAKKAFTVNNRDLHKFCALYTQESEIEIDLDTMWRQAPVLTASLCLSLMSPRFLGTRAAHEKRETLLKWLPAKLMEIDSVLDLPFGIVHDVYMHCSYADGAYKHNIKKSINTLIRRHLLREGFEDRVSRNQKPKLYKKTVKPTILVVMEWFSGAHSVYRTHSLSLVALRERFYVVGMGYAHAVDELGRAVFDEFVEIDSQKALLSQVRDVMDQAERLDPVIFYCPAVGMFPLTIFLANLRFAPIQTAALGHGASSMAKCMDYYVLDEDFIGDPACFSEELIRMPTDGMPFVRSSAQQELVPVLRENPSVVRVAVASSLMKFNPRFLQACQQIVLLSRVPVELHFMPGMAVGLGHVQLKTLVARYMPSAVVHAHLPYPEYMQQLNQCDMYINPFPYGNMNGIADMAFQGLVGICRTGPDVHEHIDEGIFRRLGLPDWLIAQTDDAYVLAALRLIENPAERLELRRNLLDRKAVEVLYQGRPEILGHKLHEMVQALK